MSVTDSPVVESAMMATATRYDSASASKAQQCDVPVVAVAATLALAAAGSLLGYSLMAPRRRRSFPGQLCLGAVMACAGVVTWKKRQQEAAAAHHVLTRMRKASDARWLKKHPIAYA